MRDFAGMTNLDVWYARADVDDLQAQFQSQKLWLATDRQSRIATFRRWLTRRGDRLG